MRCRLRALGSALLLQVVLLGADAAAAPLLQDDASPSRAQAGLLEVSAPDEDASHDAPAARRQNPAAAGDEQTVPARAVDESAAAAMEPTPARPSAARTAAGSGEYADIDPDLKEAAKASLQWAHEVKEMVLPSGPGAADGMGTETAWAGDPPPRNTWPGVEYSSPSQPAPGQGRHVGAGPNLIDEAIELFREITGHPVTWLLLPIVAFGGAAALVMQYRPQLEKGWRHRRAAHRRHESSDPSRGHRHHRHHHHHHGTSAGAQSLPLPARRTEKSSSGRARGHRSSKPRRTL